MLVELPVVQPETLRYSGSLVFSWFFWIGRLAVRTTGKAGFWRVQKGRIRGGSYGEERGTWCPDRQRKLFQLCNWRRLARYTVCEKETLCPTAEFPYLRLRQAGDDRCEQHGSIHETSAVAG
jgi:hypothetical protein